MIIATRWSENNWSFPELLTPALVRFTCESRSAIRALILRRLPYLQSRKPDLGWKLFYLALKEEDQRLWKIAEPCLYYAYRNRFEQISAVLNHIVTSSSGESLETWGRISALAAFHGHVIFPDFIDKLQALASIDAWKGAATVWAHKENISKHKYQCLSGIIEGLNQANEIAETIMGEMSSLFDKVQPLICIPIDIVDRYFTVIEQTQTNNRFHIHGFEDWLNAMSQSDPFDALAAAERFANFLPHKKYFLYQFDSIAQMLTRLFREAEEKEESDEGRMLCRVIALQDAFLAIGVNGLQEWLRKAERPD